MLPVIITAFAVGGATMIGVALGFIFKNLPPKFNDHMLGFAAGIMMAALTVGLILPALDYGGGIDTAVVVAGLFIGALFIDVLGRVLPEETPVPGHDMKARRTVIMFVAAMAIHNLPEGMACGVSLGTHDVGTAISVATGIALQNFPEGMVIVYPMLSAGFSKRKTALLALSTGVVEIIGTFIGYATAAVAGMLMPFVLSFAAGTMLFVVVADMAPKIKGSATYSFVTGFAVMLLMDVLL